MFGFRNKALIDRMYGEIMAAARQPDLYLGLGVPDTYEGRFEMLVVHATLVLRRLKALPAPAPACAQDLSDAVFRYLDVGLREAGVGDTVVPKRMRKLAEAFYGRASAYDVALAGGETLDAVVARNVLAGQGDGAALARYVEAAADGLAHADFDTIVRGPIPWPAPGRFVRQV